MSIITSITKQNTEIIITSLIQIFGDIGCAILAARLFFQKNIDIDFKLAYFFIFFSFIAMTIDDIYYNYMYRIMHYNIRNSTGILVTLTFIFFQLSQVYNWVLFIYRQRIKIFSQQNISYLLCSGFVVCVLIYFFYSNQDYPVNIIIVQSIEVMIDMCIWLFAIICFANTKSRAISLLTLGALLIISADLTTRCLYVFEPEKLANTMWVHTIWALGVVIIFFGLYCVKGDNFSFAPQNSLQVASSSRMVLTSFIAFTLGVMFLTLFNVNLEINMHSILWGLPIILMFTLIISISLAKKFSALLAEPIDQILQRMNIFDSGKMPPEDTILAKIAEFNVLGGFINSTMKKLSNQLDRELKIAAQVAHDIRSPLSALQILTEQQLIELEESKRILLRDAVYQIRDIVNNLDQNSFSKSTETQIAILLEHIISERRAALIEKSIQINQKFEVESYALFCKVLPSDIRRVFTNLINNSFEAVQPGIGVINISLSCNDSEIIIIISDNGCGIPDNIQKSLFSRGFTTKKGGSGLGLFHARETILQSKGTIDIKSKINDGTHIIIKLPIQSPPSWFLTKLVIPDNSIIVCVDDSISIWNAWQEKLKKIPANLELRYCNNRNKLLRELGKEDIKPKIYLVDYEFSGQSYTGLDLIKKIEQYKKNSDLIFLVTSRSDEAIHEYRTKNPIKIVSKFFALKIIVEIT